MSLKGGPPIIHQKMLQGIWFSMAQAYLLSIRVESIVGLAKRMLSPAISNLFSHCLEKAFKKFSFTRQRLYYYLVNMKCYEYKIVLT